MKKEYLSPKVKVQFMVADPLMDVSVSNSEIEEGFEEGAKDVDLEEDQAPLFHIETKSVWED